MVRTPDAGDARIGCVVPELPPDSSPQEEARLCRLSPRWVRVGERATWGVWLGRSREGEEEVSSQGFLDVGVPPVTNRINLSA